MSADTSITTPTASPIGLAVYTMWLRELVRFARQKSRLFGAVATPLVFWLVIGAGFGRSFAGGDGEGTDYLAYFFPGIVVLTVLFTAIYSTISVIEDRKEGFLQGVLVAPVSRAGVVLGKMLGGATMAMMQAVLMLIIAPLFGIKFSFVAALLATLVLIPIAFSLTGLGLIIAWTMDSTSGFHAIMNLVLMPMWLLCGAVFPVTTAHAAVRVAMVINPLTYGLDAFRRALYMHSNASGRLDWPIWICLLVTLVFAALMAVIPVRLANRKGESGK